MLEDRADYEMDCQAYEEAALLYEQCLMLSQEQENMKQEAAVGFLPVQVIEDTVLF